MPTYTWTEALHLASERVTGLIHEAVEEFEIDAATELLQRTPVDTGRARRNWYASTRAGMLRRVWRGQPGASFRMPVTPRERYNTIHNIEHAKLGDRVKIMQSMPYMSKIETGEWSKMAPLGVLHIGANAVRSRWNNRKKKISLVVTER